MFLNRSDTPPPVPERHSLMMMMMRVSMRVMMITVMGMINHTILINLINYNKDQPTCSSERFDLIKFDQLIRMKKRI